MINIIRQLVPPVILQFLVRARGFVRRSYGLNALDKKLARYLPKRQGYFVELGANDGISQSNTYFFERHRGWRGVLIEPTPHNFLNCLKNRSNENEYFCNACVSFDYDSKFVEIAFANLMSTPIGLESDIENPLDHAESGVIFLEPKERVLIFGSPAKTLNEILTLAQAPRQIDLLSLDVEGAEIEVLKGIDHSHFRFDFICVESRDYEKIEKFLETKNYEFLEKLSHHDYLFVDRSRKSQVLNSI